jgi:hypothetical protein
MEGPPTHLEGLTFLVIGPLELGQLAPGVLVVHLRGHMSIPSHPVLALYAEV